MYSMSAASGILKETAGHIKLRFKEIVGNRRVTRLLTKCSFLRELCVTDENVMYMGGGGGGGWGARQPSAPSLDFLEKMKIEGRRKYISDINTKN
jgi:hypothetical protein